MNAPSPRTPRALHGSADLFSARRVTLAWGILRGATEASTLVIVRIVVAPKRSAPWASSASTRSRKAADVAAADVDGNRIDVRIPRAQFADFPRTEFRLYASVPKAPSDSPKLVVYYLGIPDTTPEFASEAALETYLAARIAQARSAGGKKP